MCGCAQAAGPAAPPSGPSPGQMLSAADKGQQDWLHAEPQMLQLLVQCWPQAAMSLQPCACHGGGQMSAPAELEFVTPVTSVVGRSPSSSLPARRGTL